MRVGQSRDGGDRRVGQWRDTGDRRVSRSRDRPTLRNSVLDDRGDDGVNRPDVRMFTWVYTVYSAPG